MSVGPTASVSTRFNMSPVRFASPEDEPPSRAVQWGHQSPESVHFACDHLVQGAEAYYRHFTGKGGDFNLLCSDCVSSLPTSPPLQKLCGDCRDEMLTRSQREDCGSVSHPTHSTTLHFEHTRVIVPGLAATDVIAQVGIRNVADAWVMLDRTGKLHRVDLSAPSLTVIGSLDGTDIDFANAVTLVAADDGSVLAVAETFGRRACVIDGVTGKVTQRLQRDDYHPEQCAFPLALFRHQGRLRLLRATEWNRLDVSDPITGMVLTTRDTPRYGKPLPPHYLDYFHGSVLVSPDGRHVIDDGWVWHPHGVVMSFSLERWLTENVWESEDGPSRKTITDRGYFWNGPKCWLDDRTAAIWGIGDDDLTLVPGVHIVDVVSGEVRTFLGPAKGLACVPPYLVSFAPAAGTSVWEVGTGELLARADGFCPLAQHDGTRTFLSVDGEAFVLSRLR